MWWRVIGVEGGEGGLFLGPSLSTPLVSTHGQETIRLESATAQTSSTSGGTGPCYSTGRVSPVGRRLSP